MTADVEGGLVIRLVCGECGEPLHPTDEGSAPYFGPHYEDGNADLTGMWSIDLSDMGCPGIEREWTAVYDEHVGDGGDPVPGDSSPGWQERWHAFCVRHYATWRCDVVRSPRAPDAVATPQERTQGVSGAPAPAFEVVGSAIASVDERGDVTFDEAKLHPELATVIARMDMPTFEAVFDVLHEFTSAVEAGFGIEQGDDVRTRLRDKATTIKRVEFTFDMREA